MRQPKENIACPPGCGECCHKYRVFVDMRDCERMAYGLDMKVGDFITRYVNPETLPERDEIGWLKIRSEGDVARDPCVFLTRTTISSPEGQFEGEKCSIYHYRPQACRDYSPVGCVHVKSELWEYFPGENLISII
ncbi:MAG: YkgJ family cysteine cluster protein [Candidatus Eremiobacteraeota bacterium]|nr:YkgJ family cysteine cluster protein [Candidatus Eremiobacteraeota bacterium]